ncbi:MAG: DUF1150 family protein [Alphaproteobacteria bacterium]|nr:DUF1150 family protein [Alphaproteobacteria bacterium]
MPELLKSASPLSRQALLAIGLEEVAYIRRHLADGMPRFAVHAADGRLLGDFDAQASAAAACWQNDLEPVSVH